jgi:hypothetical protein
MHVRVHREAVKSLLLPPATLLASLSLAKTSLSTAVSASSPAATATAPQVPALPILQRHKMEMALSVLVELEVEILLASAVSLATMDSVPVMLALAPRKEVKSILLLRQTHLVSPLLVRVWLSIVGFASLLAVMDIVLPALVLLILPRRR